MRNGSMSLVPILIGIMVLFWSMMFIGGGSDTLHQVSNVKNLQHLQTKLLISAAKHRSSLAKANPTWSPEQLTTATDTYIDAIMVLNNIQPEQD